jgi:hypothetical protein
MQQQLSRSTRRDTIVIIGGSGGLEARYRDIIEGHGYNFRYYEARMPNKLARASGRITLVLVIVTMVSHPLMARARELAGDSARIVYLKSPSVSAVRQALESQPAHDLCERGAA